MKKSEFGRSMIEMLGVLAIIGVLSVAGLYGYTLAMRKHKTNEIIQEVVLRANQASTRLVLGVNVDEVGNLGKAHLPSGEYSFTAESCGTGKPCSDAEKQFRIVMTGTIQPEICRQLYADMGNSTVIRGMGRANAYTSANDCGTAEIDSLSFVFNKDLSQ